MLRTWKDFVRGKRGRDDVAVFGLRLSDNLLTLHEALRSGEYVHDLYEHFRVNDPKPRDIYKASVRDRIVHRLVYNALLPFFDRRFVSTSFAARPGKGLHHAIRHFSQFAREVSDDHRRTVWVLQCDIRKFFASIDHCELYGLLEDYVTDERLAALIVVIVRSFGTPGQMDKGLPLGNLTSQLLSNIYLHELDCFVLDELRAQYYIRYADDFVLLSADRGWLERRVPAISIFLREQLKLSLHPNKVSITTLASGVDFLGWVHFPHHRVLRTTTKRRMFKRLAASRRLPPQTTEGSRLPSDHVLASYLGLLSHGNTHALQEKVQRTHACGEEMRRLQ